MPASHTCQIFTSQPVTVDELLICNDSAMIATIHQDFVTNICNKLLKIRY